MKWLSQIFSVLTQTHDDIVFAVNHLSPPQFCHWLLCAGALSTGGAGLQPSRNVKYASGLSCCPLRKVISDFSLSTKTHEDIVFAVNHLSPSHFRHWLLCAGASYHSSAGLQLTRNVKYASGLSCYPLRNGCLRIFFINPNSWWYCICSEPSLSFPFLLLIVVCWGFVH